MKIRKPIVAGTFYFNDRKKIENFVKKIDYKGSHDAIGIISPHAGWIFSGKTAIKAIRSLKKFKTIILLGVNHQGYGHGISLYSNDSIWELPNGRLKINNEINDFIIKRSNGKIVYDNESHNYEHSIEVQLPLLIEEYGTEFTIVPISIWDYSMGALQFLSSIMLQIKRNFKEMVFLASSDFTHYETANYAKKMDNMAIEKILNNDPDGFYNIVKQNNISICGLGPIYTLLNISKKENLKPELIEYTNSGEITGEFNQVVAYCSIKFI